MQNIPSSGGNSGQGGGEQFPPVRSLPDPAIYATMREEGIIGLLKDVYRHLAASSIGNLFPGDEAELMKAAEKSAYFFIGICGGPPLYEQHFGPPRMRARHFPFPIDRAARDAWVACWHEVLSTAVEKHGFPPEHIEGFTDYLDTFSFWMINR